MLGKKSPSLSIQGIGSPKMPLLLQVPLTLVTSGGAHCAPPNGFLFFSRKFFPATYDETLCKFLLYTYKDSHNLFWSKKLSREHKEYFYVAWVENVNFKNCNFRVLRSILEGFFIKQKLFKIKKYKRQVTFVFRFEHFWSQKT